ncbi:MAG: type II secretion system protein GspD [Thiothrix sp.]|nr:MAG: type II secretion system protein GspD [Thiothrix sp.]
MLISPLKRLTLVITLCFIVLTPPSSAEEGATLNLKDADIRVLIDTVSEITGKNFVIDPRVKAKVTIISAQPMQESELYQVFLSILQVHGFSAVETGNVTKIVPDVNAKQGPVPTANGKQPGKGDQLVTRVIHIENVPAAQLVPILRPLIPQQGQLAAYQPSNILLISDRAANVSRLLQIIKRIDRPDQSDIEVIRLENAPAAELARTLSTLQKRDNKSGAMPGMAVITADERTNSILISGDQATRLRLRGLIAHLDTPLDTGGNTQVIFLKYADAEELSQILTGVSKSKAQKSTKSPGGSSITKRSPVKRDRVASPGSSSGSLGTRKEVSIQADTINNALIITAPPAEQQELRQVIAQLDIRRAQVMIEAIIAEVSIDLSKEIGTGIAVRPKSNGNDSGPAFATNLGGLTNTILGLANGNTGGIPAGILLGGGDFREGKTNFGILLKALASDAATNILSTPTLLTLDNVEAEMTVGQEVPFLTGQFSSTGAGNNSTTNSVNPFQTIERKDVGLTLKVKPQINEGDAIQLEIEQETSNIAPSSVSAADVITNKRTIKTTVLADDGQVIVLGGLSDDEFRDTREKVPLLGDIPLIGHLFRYNSTQKLKRTLMVFIHPVILRDAATTTAYTDKKYTYFRDRQLEAGIEKRGLIRDSAAIIPDLDQLITQLPKADDNLIQQLPYIEPQSLPAASDIQK